MINENILDQYLHNNYGYGAFESDIWFITLHSGAPEHSEFDLDLRLNIWNTLGKPELFDAELLKRIEDYIVDNQDIKKTIKALKENKIVPKPENYIPNKINQTYAGLIKILYGYYGWHLDIDKIKSFEHTDFANIFKRDNEYYKEYNPQYYQCMLNLFAISSRELDTKTSGFYKKTAPNLSYLHNNVLYIPKY